MVVAATRATGESPTIAVRRPTGSASPKPEGVGGRHQLGTVAVGEHRVAQLVRVRRHPLLPGTVGHRTCAPAQHLVGDGREQRLLVREVPVERARLDAEVGGQAPHREVGQPVSVENLERMLDDVGTAVAHPPSSQAGTVMCHHT